MESKTEECIEWLRSECDVSFLAESKLKEIVSLILKWDTNNAEKRAKATFEREEKRKQDEATREDYKEEVDENGRTWYIETHWSHQRPDSRKLSPGNIIKFKSYRGEGIMVVGSFDFESDFAARSYYMFEDVLSEDGKTTFQIVGHSYTPGIRKFSFATDEEIADFFIRVKEQGKIGLSNETVFDFYFKSDFPSNEIKGKLAKYIV